MAANKARIPLAKMAVEETGMGVVEDKVIKNHYASEYIYNAYTQHEDLSACMEEDPAFGIKKIAEPIGVVAAVIPTTNPTSTAIFKTLLCAEDPQRASSSARIRALRSARRRLRASCYEAAVRGGRAGGHHRLDRRSLSLRIDERADERSGHHSGDGRPRHGECGVFLRQTGAGRRRGQHAGRSSTRPRISSWPSTRSSIPRRLTTA